MTNTEPTLAIVPINVGTKALAFVLARLHAAEQKLIKALQDVTRRPTRP